MYMKLTLADVVINFESHSSIGHVTVFRNDRVVSCVQVSDANEFPATVGYRTVWLQSFNAELSLSDVEREALRTWAMCEYINVGGDAALAEAVEWEFKETIGEATGSVTVIRNVSNGPVVKIENRIAYKNTSAILTYEVAEGPVNFSKVGSENVEFDEIVFSIMRDSLVAAYS